MNFPLVFSSHVWAWFTHLPISVVVGTYLLLLELQNGFLFYKSLLGKLSIYALQCLFTYNAKMCLEGIWKEILSVASLYILYECGNIIKPNFVSLSNWFLRIVFQLSTMHTCFCHEPLNSRAIFILFIRLISRSINYINSHKF